MRVCPHLEHAMMATENADRECQSCKIKRLEAELAEAKKLISNYEFLTGYSQHDCRYSANRIQGLQAQVEQLKKERSQAVETLKAIAETIVKLKDNQ